MALLRCVQSFSAGHRVVRAGDIVRSDDEVVTPARRQFFEPFDASAPVVEQATAAPGELRRVPKRGK